jgi:hypothetical protein
MALKFGQNFHYVGDDLEVRVFLKSIGPSRRFAKPVQTGENAHFHADLQAGKTGFLVEEHPRKDFAHQPATHAPGGMVTQKPYYGDSDWQKVWEAYGAWDAKKRAAEDDDDENDDAMANSDLTNPMEYKKLQLELQNAMMMMQQERKDAARKDEAAEAKLKKFREDAAAAAATAVDPRMLQVLLNNVPKYDEKKDVNSMRGLYVDFFEALGKHKIDFTMLKLFLKEKSGLPTTLINRATTVAEAEKLVLAHCEATSADGVFSIIEKFENLPKIDASTSIREWTEKFQGCIDQFEQMGMPIDYKLAGWYCLYRAKLPSEQLAAVMGIIKSTEKDTLRKREERGMCSQNANAAITTCISTNGGTNASSFSMMKFNQANGGKGSRYCAICDVTGSHDTAYCRYNNKTNGGGGGDGNKKPKGKKKGGGKKQK